MGSETWAGPPHLRPSALSSPSSVLFSPVTPVPSATAALADGHSSRWPHLMRPTTSSLPATALRSRAVRSSSNLTPSQNALLVPNALLASLASARKKLLRLSGGSSHPSIQRHLRHSHGNLRADRTSGARRGRHPRRLWPLQGLGYRQVHRGPGCYRRHRSVRWCRACWPPNERHDG